MKQIIVSAGWLHLSLRWSQQHGWILCGPTISKDSDTVNLCFDISARAKWFAKIALGFSLLLLVYRTSVKEKDPGKHTSLPSVHISARSSSAFFQFHAFAIFVSRLSLVASTKCWGMPEAWIHLAFAVSNLIALFTRKHGASSCKERS